MTNSTEPMHTAIAIAAAGNKPVQVGLMCVLIEAPTAAAARDALEAGVAAHDAAGDPWGADHLRALIDLWRAHPHAWATVRSMIATISHEPTDRAAEETLGYLASAFDRLVAASPEASVALYSLGSAELLDAATREVVDRMEEWGLFGPSIDALDLGCGIGRFAPALAARVRSVLGLDLSAGMIAEARRRHASLPNVRFLVSSGRDLAGVATASLDLILAVDSFPYIVAAGLADVYLAETARVMRVAGKVLIFNFSYCGDDERDRRELGDAARRNGLDVDRDGMHDLRCWDAATFILRRPGT